MGFFTLWLVTSIGSICMECWLELRMVKNLADSGYKVDIQRSSASQNQVDEYTSSDNFKLSLMMLFVPIFNIALMLYKASVGDSMMQRQLDAMGFVEEMTSIEKENYKKKPTGLNAILVPLIISIKLENAIILNVMNGTREEQIFFELGDSISDIEILKVNGGISRLSVEQLKQKVVDALKGMMEIHHDEEQLIEMLRNNRINLTIHFNETKDNEAFKLDNNKQEQVTHNFENNLSQDFETFEEKKENGPKLTKHRKNRYTI